MNHLLKLFTLTIKVLAVIFFFMIVLESIQRNTQMFSENFLDGEFKVVNTYKNDNYIFLNSLSSNKHGKESSKLVLRYSLISKSDNTIKYLVISSENGSVIPIIEKGSLLTVLFSILYFIYGIYVIINFMRKHFHDLKFGYDAP